MPPHLWEDMAKALEVDPKEFAKFMLRYTNPWAYGLIFGMTPELRAELNTIPERYTD